MGWWRSSLLALSCNRWNGDSGTFTSLRRQLGPELQWWTTMHSRGQGKSQGSDLGKPCGLRNGRSVFQSVLSQDSESRMWRQFWSGSSSQPILSAQRGVSNSSTSRSTCNVDSYEDELDGNFNPHRFGLCSHLHSQNTEWLRPSANGT